MTKRVVVILFVARDAGKAAINAVDEHKDSSRYIQLLGNVIAPAVKAVSDTFSNRLMNVTRMNVIMTVERLRDKTPVLDFYHDQKRIRIEL